MLHVHLRISQGLSIFEHVCIHGCVYIHVSVEHAHPYTPACLWMCVFAWGHMLSSVIYIFAYIVVLGLLRHPPTLCRTYYNNDTIVLFIHNVYADLCGYIYQTFLGYECVWACVHWYTVCMFSRFMHTFARVCMYMYVCMHVCVDDVGVDKYSHVLWVGLYVCMYGGMSLGHLFPAVMHIVNGGMYQSPGGGFASCTMMLPEAGK